MSSALCLRNRQRSRPVDSRLLRQMTRSLLVDLLSRADFELAIHLVSEPAIARLNESFLRHHGPTDVITFPYENGAPARSVPTIRPAKSPGMASPALHGVTLPTGHRPDATRPLRGEIFICVEEAAAQARRFRTTWPAELVRYLIHGVLHLLGHDDTNPKARRRMKREEDRLLRELRRRFPLSKLAHKPKMTP